MEKADALMKLRTSLIVTAVTISAIIGSVEAEEATLQWCATMYKQFLDGITRKIYALPNAVVCETSQALAFYHEHHEGDDDEAAAKEKFLAFPQGSKCTLEKKMHRSN
jgi:hypothetical protein